MVSLGPVAVSLCATQRICTLLPSAIRLHSLIMADAVLPIPTTPETDGCKLDVSSPILGDYRAHWMQQPCYISVSIGWVLASRAGSADRWILYS